MTIATYPSSLVIHCRHHCGRVETRDAAVIRGTLSIVEGLRLRQVTLGAITCPNCHEEVRASDVQQPVDMWLAKGTR